MAGFRAVENLIDLFSIHIFSDNLITINHEQQIN